MVEQIVNMKKRYRALVERYTKEDFEGYFAEFLALHQCVTSVRWGQESDQGHFLVIAADVFLSPTYLVQHPELKHQLVDEEWYDTLSLSDGHKHTCRELWDAVDDLEKLFLGEDVLEHVFGDGVEITATKAGIKIYTWGEDVTSSD